MKGSQRRVVEVTWLVPMNGWWQREASSVTVEHPTLIDHIITVPAAIDAAAGFAGNLGAGGIGGRR